MTNNEWRTERDSMGDVAVPANAKWAAQTQRAVQNFPISGTTIEPALIHALGRIKGAAARQNGESGDLDPAMAEAIAIAAAEVANGDWDREFPIDVFQTGSGTSSNMNANEVIANLASQKSGSKVHPNDHVNMAQSSNDVFPSAIHVATADSLTNQLLPALKHLAAALRAKQVEFADVVKSGRTHLMDATPVTLGQEFGGYASAIEHGIERIEMVLPHVGELPLGGTAVGTGINAPAGFAAGVIQKLVADTGLPLSEARDHFEAHGARDALVEASGQLKTVAISLYKMANDLRWMGSGPRTGLAEIQLPDLQPGSSIMPGKVNPVLPEAVCQVVAQVVGNDAAVTWGGGAGNFELNVMLPVIARNLLESIRLVGNVSTVLADRCVSGIEANVENCRRFAESSPSVGTSLNAHIGYDEAASVIKQSVKENKTLREVLLERELMNDDDIDRVLDVMAMTKGGIIK